MFWRSGNQLLTFLRSYRIRVTSKIQVNFRLRRFSVVDFVLWIFTISSVFMFLRSSYLLLTFLLRCHVWVTSNIPDNPLYLLQEQERGTTSLQSSRAYTGFRSSSGLSTSSACSCTRCELVAVLRTCQTWWHPSPTCLVVKDWDLPAASDMNFHSWN